MNKPLQTILTAGFILLAGLPVTYSIYFIISKVCIHHRMREEIKSGELTTLILEKTDLHWMEAGRELLINDRMFDIADITPISDDKVKVTGVYDDAETELYAELNRSLDHDEADNAAAIFPFIYYQLTFDNGSSACYEMNAAPVSMLVHTNLYSEFFPPVFLSLQLPPPKA